MKVPWKKIKVPEKGEMDNSSWKVIKKIKVIEKVKKLMVKKRIWKKFKKTSEQVNKDILKNKKFLKK